MTLGHDLGALKLKPSEKVSNLIHQSFILFNSVTQLSTSRPWWKLWPTAFRICPVTTFSKFCSSEETIEDFDPKDINTILVDLIVAGISTTTYFLCLLLHRLGQEEKIQVRLQKELDQILGRRDVVITEDHLRSLPYLKAVLKEGLRRYRANYYNEDCRGGSNREDNFYFF
ncbi:putative cytochrome P450 12d1 distal, mitochondrial, partial [Armadillidium nasatum]